MANEFQGADIDVKTICVLSKAGDTSGIARILNHRRRSVDCINRKLLHHDIDVFKILQASLESEDVQVSLVLAGKALLTCPTMYDTAWQAACTLLSILAHQQLPLEPRDEIVQMIRMLLNKVSSCWWDEERRQRIAPRRTEDARCGESSGDWLLKLLRLSLAHDSVQYDSNDPQPVGLHDDIVEVFHDFEPALYSAAIQCVSESSPMLWLELLPSLHRVLEESHWKAALQLMTGDHSGSHHRLSRISRTCTEFVPVYFSSEENAIAKMTLSKWIIMLGVAMDCLMQKNSVGVLSGVQSLLVEKLSSLLPRQLCEWISSIRIAIDVEAGNPISCCAAMVLSLCAVRCSCSSGVVLASSTLQGINNGFDVFATFWDLLQLFLVREVKFQGNRRDDLVGTVEHYRLIVCRLVKATMDYAQKISLTEVEQVLLTWRRTLQWAEDSQCIESKQEGSGSVLWSNLQLCMCMESPAYADFFLAKIGREYLNKPQAHRLRLKNVLQVLFESRFSHGTETTGVTLLFRLLRMLPIDEFESIVTSLCKCSTLRVRLLEMSSQWLCCRDFSQYFTNIHHQPELRIKKALFCLVELGNTEEESTTASKSWEMLALYIVEGTPFSSIGVRRWLYADIMRRCTLEMLSLCLSRRILAACALRLISVQQDSTGIREESDIRHDTADLLRLSTQLLMYRRVSNALVLTAAWRQHMLSHLEAHKKSASMQLCCRTWISLTNAERFHSDLPTNVVLFVLTRGLHHVLDPGSQIQLPSTSVSLRDATATLWKQVFPRRDLVVCHREFPVAHTVCISGVLEFLTCPVWNSSAACGLEPTFVFRLIRSADISSLGHVTIAESLYSLAPVLDHINETTPYEIAWTIKIVKQLCKALSHSTVPANRLFNILAHIYQRMCNESAAVRIVAKVSDLSDTSTFSSDEEVDDFVRTFRTLVVQQMSSVARNSEFAVRGECTIDIPGFIASIFSDLVSGMNGASGGLSVEFFSSALCLIEDCCAACDDVKSTSSVEALQSDLSSATRHCELLCASTEIKQLSLRVKVVSLLCSTLSDFKEKLLRSRNVNHPSTDFFGECLAQCVAVLNHMQDARPLWLGYGEASIKDCQENVQPVLSQPMRLDSKSCWVSVFCELLTKMRMGISSLSSQHHATDLQNSRMLNCLPCLIPCLRVGNETESRVTALIPRRITLALMDVADSTVWYCRCALKRTFPVHVDLSSDCDHHEALWTWLQETTSISFFQHLVPWVILCAISDQQFRFSIDEGTRRKFQTLLESLGALESELSTIQRRKQREGIGKAGELDDLLSCWRNSIVHKNLPHHEHKTHETTQKRLRNIHRKKKIRSSNHVVDEWLQLDNAREEDNSDGSDEYADLDDFLVEG